MRRLDHEPDTDNKASAAPSWDIVQGIVTA